MPKNEKPINIEYYRKLRSKIGKLTDSEGALSKLEERLHDLWEVVADKKRELEGISAPIFEGSEVERWVYRPDINVLTTAEESIRIAEALREQLAAALYVAERAVINEIIAADDIVVEARLRKAHEQKKAEAQKAVPEQAPA
jgi:hypothetical protein